VLGLDGQGGAESFADYAQWETWQKQRGSQATGLPARNPPSTTPPPLPKKLSYKEAREYAAIEQRIAEAEQLVAGKRAALEDPAIASDAPKLLAAQAEMEAAQKDLDTLYARWAQLEEKAGSLPSR
jgi:ATP-binding cassette subfamily F protein uup